MSFPGFAFGVFTLAVIVILPIASWAVSEQVLHVFGQEAYGSPSSTLIFDPAGNLYGVSAGAVFELSPSGAGVQFQVLAFLPAGSIGGGRLLRDNAGNLYGGTWQGGLNGCGFVYRLSPTAQPPWTSTILHQFACKEGAHASYGLISDASGNIYGVTHDGGINDEGSAYELSPNSDGSWTYTVLHEFSTPEGNGPQTALIFDTQGNLFGGNEIGVFELSPSSGGTWSESTAYTFSGNDGSNPLGDLMFDSAGNLYGTNQAGGQYFGGTAFRLTPNGSDGWTSTVLHSFGGSKADGYAPYSGLVADAAGNLYGNTLAGGSSTENGIVYELSPGANGTSTETILHRFGVTGSPKGTLPEGALVFDSAGNLYGTTTAGGDPSCYQPAGGCGVVYRLMP